MASRKRGAWTVVRPGCEWRQGDYSITSSPCMWPDGKTGVVYRLTLASGSRVAREICATVSFRTAVRIMRWDRAQVIAERLTKNRRYLDSGMSREERTAE